MTNQRFFIVYASDAELMNIDLFTTDFDEAKQQCRAMSIQSKRDFEVCELFDGTDTQKLAYGFNYDEDLDTFYEGVRTAFGLDFNPIKVDTGIDTTDEIYEIINDIGCESIPLNIETEYQIFLREQEAYNQVYEENLADESYEQYLDDIARGY